MPAVSDKSKELKKAEEENKILRKLLSDKEIELEVQRELLKKVWDIRSKKDLVDYFYTKYHISKAKLIHWVGLSDSTYYFKGSGKPKGNKATLLTYHKTQGWVNEQTVVESIKKLLEDNFMDCGYRIMSEYLKRDGYTINHKKVYRIMKAAKLLQTRIARDHSDKKYVKHRKVKTTRPLECIEMDIKKV